MPSKKKTIKTRAAQPWTVLELKKLGKNTRLRPGPAFQAHHP